MARLFFGLASLRLVDLNIEEITTELRTQSLASLRLVDLNKSDLFVLLRN